MSTSTVKKQATWTQPDYAQFTGIVNAPADGVYRHDVLSYTNQAIQANIPNLQTQAKVAAVAANNLTPKTTAQIIDAETALGAAALSGASNLEAVLKNPAVADGIKGAAKMTAVGALATSLYASVEAIKQAGPADPNYELAKAFIQAGAGVIAGEMAAALAADGAFVSLLGAGSALPFGVAAIGLAAGYGVSQILGYFLDPLLEQNAQHVLDTAEGIDNFVQGAMNALDGLMDQIFDAPNFFDGLPEFLDNMIPSPDFTDGIPPWLQDALAPIIGTPGTRVLQGSGCPLVIDLDGDGVSLIALEDSHAAFDLRGDGFAERTAWVAPTDGLLVRDVNGNGTIDTVSELFGSDRLLEAMINTDFQTLATTENGFATLALLDSNLDGMISSADTAWATLSVWQDANSNGVTEAGKVA